MRTDCNREKLQPHRLGYARNKITNLGYEITGENKTTLRFEFKGSTIMLHPYTGWFSGKNIEDGRGIKNLIKQIR